jgi:hypothetical protein
MHFDLTVRIRLSLYVDGTFQAQTILHDRLGTLNDVDNWLGRSQFLPDSEFAGMIHEFRIYTHRPQRRADLEQLHQGAGAAAHAVSGVTRRSRRGLRPPAPADAVARARAAPRFDRPSTGEG